jgi:IPT/TIG domain-containing protein
VKRFRWLGFRLILALVLALSAVPLFGVVPARAAVPTVAAFVPLTGVVGTSVTIAGTGFQDASVATGVAFNGVAATTFTVNSDIQITATVPAGATTGPISVSDSEGTGTSLLSFTVTSSPPPAIAAFLPASGSVGTSVDLTGTGLTGASSVKFNGTSATYTVESDTQIKTTVPAGATTGLISVTTPGGTATSLTDFTVTAQQVERHTRSLTLALRGHPVVRGRVNAADGFDECVSNVTVKIQRKRQGRWRTVGKDQTDAQGNYSKTVRDRPGAYRAVAVKKVLGGGADICKVAASPRRTNR